jgi:hypothetical protein
VEARPRLVTPVLILIAHRILIGTAIGFGVFYTAWEVLAFRRTHDPVHVLIALIAAVVTLGMAYYLKNLRRFVSHR